MPFEAAQVGLELTRALSERGDTASALERAVAASETFEQLGSGGAREAGRVVKKLGGRGAAASSIGLTRRELEVLAFVARGLSNRQIAERLVVSEHTVHRHLANTYVRLGVSSRAAAVAVAVERGLLD
jgi:DNA-binding NarL/FixJ family response regulator